MKLLNIDEDAPDYFYIFLDFNDKFGFMHKNNFELTKRINSGIMINIGINQGEILKEYINGTQKYAPFILSNETVPSQTSFTYNITKDYSLEYNLELYRYTNNCKYPSRFSALYAFGDYDTCVEVNKKYGWDLNTVKKFKLVKDDARSDFTRITKHNMEVVSLMHNVECRFFPIEEQNKIYEHYWSGKGNFSLMQGETLYNSGEIYEYLIEGILELVEN